MSKFKTNSENTDKRMALVIGNSDYSKNPDFESFENAEKNCKRMKASLSKKGYEVKTLLDVGSPQEIQQLFIQMLRMVTRKEQIMTFAIFVYYCGHTVEIEGDTHLVLNNEDDKKFNIDEAIRKQARQEKNITTLFVESSRTEKEEEKCGVEFVKDEEIVGFHYVIHSSKKQKYRKLDTPNAEGIYPVTDSLCSLFDSKEAFAFPTVLDDWEKKDVVDIYSKHKKFDYEISNRLVVPWIESTEHHQEIAYQQRISNDFLLLELESEYVDMADNGIFKVRTKDGINQPAIKKKVLAAAIKVDSAKFKWEKNFKQTKNEQIYADFLQPVYRVRQKGYSTSIGEKTEEHFLEVEKHFMRQIVMNQKSQREGGEQEEQDRKTIEDTINEVAKVWTLEKVLKENFELNQKLLSEFVDFKRFMLDDGRWYQGNTIHNLPHGRGHSTNPDGSTFVGSFNQGRMEGPGQMTFDNGAKCIGHFKDNHLTGMASMTYPGGNRYIGEFLGSKRHGVGTLTYSNGTVYKGAFINDQKGGKGEMTWKNGVKYEGEWLKDKKHGVGKILFKNGALHQGEFKEDLMDGKGQKTFANGDRYNGQFKAGMYHGLGLLNWADGRKYQGSWEEGVQCGKGILQRPDGTVLKGTFKNAVLNGEGVFQREQIIYKGDFVDGKFEGQGTIFKEGKGIYKGAFLNNLKHGEGTFKKDDGVYKAEFEFDKVVEGTENKVQDAAFQKTTAKREVPSMPEEFAGLVDATKSIAQVNAQNSNAVNSKADIDADVPQDW